MTLLAKPQLYRPVTLIFPLLAAPQFLGLPWHVRNFFFRVQVKIEKNADLLWF
jgi:hypothetical protein